MIDWIAGGFFGGMGLVILFGLGYGAVDMVQYLRSRDAAYACVERNLEPYRRDLSSRVVCRSRNTGADSLTVISK